MSTEVKKLEYEEGKKESILEWLLKQKKGLLAHPLELFVCLLSVSLSIYHLYVAYAGSLEAHAFRSTHLAFVMVLCFMLRPLGRSSWTAPKNAWFGLDLFFVALTIAIQVYTLWDLDAFIFRRGDLTDMDIWAGTIMIILLLEVTRRVVGWAMVIIAAFFLVQTTFSDYFFGLFYGPPSDWFTIIDYLFMRENGIYGIPLMVMATYIFLFILFGSILVRSGAGRFFINVALALTGSRVGGPAKASVVSSCLMASVSGSAVANVVTTGSFTIPLMKRIGYKPYFAGAVEACSSSGGQIMPPVMGAAAFVIAEFMNVPYLYVALAGLFPALIYFFSIFIMVHFEARKKNLATVPKEELPNLKQELKRGGHLFISILVIVVLMIIGYTPMFAAFWAIISILVLSSLRKETRMSPTEIFSALEEGARQAVSVSVACATAGIIIGCVFVSGLGLKFTNVIVTVAGGELWIALILTMIASLILGMGLTTTAVYITLAALVIPALTKMGVAPISAHLFAFYFGLVSAITPPVALASFAAAGIAGSNPMQTGFHSFRLGIAKYILPFVFVFNPAMVFVGDWYHIVSAVTGGFVGIYALTVTTEGWMLGRTGWPVRILMGIAALMMFHPDILTDLAGGVLAVVVFFFHWRQHKSDTALAPEVVA
ncbi:MAG: TRAP transporter permease [Desulfarculaceae bacterium]|nr:TRAP transporter permease [Desulfarculaceae bacterium]MCF8071247.1 TRAP transporter permease [Desulfarculaceae bacterium]MCF8101150.1 TRAP transporter permease [Desulfarculaceae bacterium]MCF8115301.1 TRAP transporter permease [Desulfarculaceae bacterium]